MEIYIAVVCNDHDGTRKICTLQFAGWQEIAKVLYFRKNVVSFISFALN